MGRTHRMLLPDLLRTWPMEILRRGRLSTPFHIQTRLCTIIHHSGHLRGVRRCYVILVRPVVTLGIPRVQGLGRLMVESMVELVQAHPYAIYCPRVLKMYYPNI